MRKVLPWILPLLRTTLFILDGWLFIIITNQSLEDASKWWPLLCIVYNIITIIILQIVCRYEGITFRSLIGNGNKQVHVKATILFTIMMLVIGVGGMLGFSLIFYGGLPEFLIKPIPVWVSIITMVLLPITIVFAELPLYFGYAFNRIKTRTGNSMIAISYTVFFYALQHSFIPLLFDARFVLFRFLSFLPLMIFLGITYSKKRNLTQMMIGHGVMDFSTGFQVLLISILSM